MKFFATYKEAKTHLAWIQRQYPETTKNVKVYDLKKTHPRRKKTRFLVGTYFDWLTL